MAYPVPLDEWPDDPVIVERVPLRSRRRRGAAIDVIADRSRHNHSRRRRGWRRLPGGQRRRLRSDLRDWRRFITNDHDAAEDICWVAAPVWPPPMDRCVAAIAALVVAPTQPPHLKDAFRF